MRFASLLLAGAGLAGCRDAATIWSAESVSPDGQWVASAHTEQFGGPGTAGVQTEVFLRRRQAAEKPVEVLGLTNTTAYPVGVTAVDLRWLSPTHLDVGFKDAEVDLQMTKYAGLSVSASENAVTAEKH